MIVLATDLDRTLLPNGKNAYDGTLPQLFSVIKKKKLALVYVTGRNLELFKEAMREFKIEVPDYMIGDVGTTIYKKDNNALSLDSEWINHISVNVPDWDIQTMKDMLRANRELRLQEETKQNKYKLSYYLDDISKEKEILKFVKDELNIFKDFVDVVYSVDQLKKKGLIDILPKIATKATALEFLRKRLDVSKESVIFCGDSGNDILALTNGYISILVKNALENIKVEVSRINKEKNFGGKLYIANGTGRLNGNYSSGILEGLIAFGIISEKDLN